MTSTLLAALACACAYDWSVPSPSADAGANANDGGADAVATGDSGGTDAGGIDAGVADAIADGGPVDCAALFRAVDDARAAAKKCVSSAGVCTTHLQDPCNCTVVVAKSGTSEDSAYVSAVANLKASGCPLGCGAPCGTAQDGLCVIVGGGPSTACSQ